MKLFHILMLIVLFSLPITQFALAQETPPAAAADEASAPAPACVPACRSGFICHAGMCISSCNPPCGAGYSCSAQGECIFQQATSPAPMYVPAPTPGYSERELARKQAREEKLRIREQRLAAVQQFRLGIHMDWQWAFTHTYNTGFMANLGFQKNVAQSFALRARVGGLIGWARADFIGEEERTSCWGANVDVSPLFGPLGTFYIGPVFWLTYKWYGKDRLQDDEWDFDYNDEETYESTNTGLTGGIGIDMGLLIGPEANVGINWRIKTNFYEEFAPTFEFGLAYHFGVGN